MSFSPLRESDSLCWEVKMSSKIQFFEHSRETSLHKAAGQSFYAGHLSGTLKIYEHVEWIGNNKQKLNWMVVWIFFPNIGNNHLNWRIIFFQRGFQPPTSVVLGCSGVFQIGRLRRWFLRHQQTLAAGGCSVCWFTNPMETFMIHEPANHIIQDKHKFIQQHPEIYEFDLA